MKTTIYTQRFIIAACTILLVFACKKNLNPEIVGLVPNPPNTTNKDSTQSQKDSSQSPTSTPIEVPFPVVTNFHCTGPDYGDTIIYPQPSSLLHDYIVSPVNNPGSGSYFAWPQGLAINPLTGAIDVTQSATGQRYAIGFVKSGTQDTCLMNLVIAGAAFADSVYVLGDNQRFANPYFNADPSLPTVCSGSNNSQCKWDITGTAKLQQIKIDGNTGIIDLQESMKAFGPLLLNGASVQTDIYYQLGDASNMATQHTPVKLIYYNKKSDIPQYLLDNINAKRTNILDQVLILLGGNPRPPLIIITRYNN